MSVHASRTGSALFHGLVRRPIALLVMVAALVVIGVLSYLEIPLQMMPDGIVEPGLQIWASHPGSSAQENEEKVARVLEEQMRTLSGLEEVESGSNDDGIWMWVSFDASTDMDLAKAEVRDRIERARPLLPSTVRDIGMWSWSDSELPVMFFAVLHPGDSPETDFLVDEVVRRRLEAVDGVGRVEIWGVLDDSMRILLDEDEVRAANLDLGDLIRRLSADNFALPMGEVTDGGLRLHLRSDMRFRSPEEIAAYPIGGGLVIGDVGRVAKVKSVRDRLFKIDGSYAYFAEVQKDSQANVVATCERLRAAFAELERDPRLAGRFQFLRLFDQGRVIEGSLATLEVTALEGGYLSVIVLFLFLWRVRLTLVVALSIPLSILFAIAWVYFAGGTFNILTMTGITLATGMLVDNAVVVVENISRLRNLGVLPREAAAEGAREVALAVLLSTLTTVVVFSPLIFMTETPQLRIIFAELGTPLCISLLFSLVAALIFLPTVTARLIGPRPARIQALADRLEPLGRAQARAFALLIGGVRFVFHLLVAGAFFLQRLVLALLTPWRALAAALVLGLLVLQAYRAWPALALSSRLHEFGAARGPSSPTDTLVWRYALPSALAVLLLLLGLPRWRRRPAAAPARPAELAPRGGSLIGFLLEANHALLRWTLQHRLLASLATVLLLASIAIPMSGMRITSFGQDEDTSRITVHVKLENNFTLWEAEEEIGYYERFFQAHKERYGFDHLGARFDETGGRISLYWDVPIPRKEYGEVARHARAELKAPPGHTILFYDAENTAAADRSRTLITFRLVGPDSEELARWGEEARRVLERVSGLSGVSTPLESAPSQVRVVLDSDLAQGLGVSPESAVNSIAWTLRGWQLPQFHEPGREMPLLIEYDDEEVEGLSTLKDLEVFGEGGSVPLSAVADLQFAQASRTIRRRNGQVTFALTARVDDPLRQRELSEAGYAALQGLDLPRGYSVGEEDLVQRRQEEEFAELNAALSLSIVLVFLLMAILFESCLLPFSVLFTIPFAFAGAVWTLYLTGTNMDSVGWIGIIILVGIVVNNGIVLIDRIHALRQDGTPRWEAVVEGCGQRVRPVVMTALTTIMGLIPMSLTEPPPDGIDYRALATCVAGGLAISTLFTLWVVPLAYTVLDDLWAAVVARTRWALRPRGWRPPAKAPEKKLDWSGEPA